MQIDFNVFWQWPLEFFTVLIGVGIIYGVLAMVTVKAGGTQRALSIALGLSGSAYIYRQVSNIGWVGGIIALLAGVLIVLLGEVIAEEDSHAV